jgi:hypothetical protein
MFYRILAQLPGPVTEGAEVLEEVLAASFEGCIPPQHLAPLCNNLPWSYIACGIVIGVMAVSISVSRIVRWLIDEGALSKVWALWTLIAMGILGALTGALVGWRTYDVVLGGWFGLIGGAGFPFLLSLLEPVFTRLGIMRRNGKRPPPPPPDTEY